MPAPPSDRLDCPLCGVTRATFALMRGDLVTALDHNVLYVLALSIVGLLGSLWVVRRRWPTWIGRPVAAWSAALVTVAFGVVRNLPFDAVSVLGSSAGNN